MNTAVQPVLRRNGGDQHNVVYDPKRDLIVARVSGTLSNKVRAEVIDQAAALSVVHDCDRLFCDYRDTEYVETTLGIYTYGEEIDFLSPLRPRFRIAVLYSRDPGAHQFWETVMVNRGFLARVFLSEKDALAWLETDR